MNNKQPEQTEKLTLYPEICLNCCWSRLEGSTLFCPFRYGTCMRRVFRSMYLNRNSEEDENDA